MKYKPWSHKWCQLRNDHKAIKKKKNIPNWVFKSHRQITREVSEVTFGFSHFGIIGKMKGFKKLALSELHVNIEIALC